MDGDMVYQAHREVGAVQRLGGVGEALATQIRALSDVEVRVTVLGHLQRGGSPTAFDRLLATRFGSMAVRFIAERKLDYMVALHDERIVPIPIAEAIARQKRVSLHSDIIQTVFALDVCLGNTRSFVESLQDEVD
jgi:6-phosphofructokinase 1